VVSIKNKIMERTYRSFLTDLYLPTAETELGETTGFEKDKIFTEHWELGGF
jgi:hypothetical protein